ncbi:hypothetical protein IG193_04790 [Infirmifilum lucidum]|uniref:Uncharacterized protein n=1 Tax=Infirmifilum lucidum TaxID=2776706 RepID=A0A7L9FEE7_9CREN|nr:hypothetical protein [Infirmifilum lucidum]QOJ78109.1 hypothetical protein IG193_04790 [Infirmifilum lucidum]
MQELVIQGVMAPRIKIEDSLPSGEKISLMIEGGDLDEAKILQILSMLKSLKASSEVETGQVAEGSLKERVWRIIVENFGDGTWFSLRDLYNIAIREMPDLKITAVSTYVTRLVSEGRLLKRGTKPNTRYRIKTLVVEKA